MDKKTLEDYRLLEHKIAALERQIAEKEHQAAQYEHGIVKGSNPDFPYQPMTFHTGGFNIRDDEKRRQRIYNLKAEYKRQKAEAERQRLEVQEFIAGIQDVMAQLIFTYLYLDGMTQSKVAQKLHLDQSQISRKMNDYLKNA